MAMRNRKIIVTAFVLVAVMLMAVGFAVLTDNLIIAGEANANTSKSQDEWEKDVYFDSATPVTTTGTSGIADEASVGQSNNDHANYKVKSLALEGQVATFKFVIANDNETYDAKITIDDGYPTNTNTKYYSVDYIYGDGDGDDDDTIVPAGGTLEVTVVVEMLQDPSENLSAQFTLNLTATSVEK